MIIDEAMTSQGVSYVFGIFYSLAFATNIIGNIIVCVVVKQCKNLQNFTSLLLVNLAVSDLALGVCGSIHLIISINGGSESHLVCSIMSSAVYLSAVVSVYTITVLAFERYIAIKRPFYSRCNVTKSKLKVIIPVIWVFAAIVSMPSLVFFTRRNDQKHDLLPCWDALTQDNFPRFYKILLLIFLYLLPMGVIAISYGKIFRHLWFTEHKKDKTTSKVVYATRRQLTKVLGMVIIVFNVCWLPWFFVDLLTSFNLIEKYVYVRSEIIAFCVILNSSINPVIYSLQSRNFRRHVRSLVKKKTENLRK